MYKFFNLRVNVKNKLYDNSSEFNGYTAPIIQNRMIFRFKI